MKLFKWLGGLVAILVAVIILAIVILPNVVDPNDYRDELSSLVKDKTGRDLTLAGDLELSVFPWLGIRTEGLSLSQPEQIGGEMLSVETAQLRVKLLPLLGKKVEVDTVVLEQPMVTLVTLKNGVDSFSGLSGDDAEPVDSEDSGQAAVALAIQGMELSNGKVVIDDRQAGSRTELSELNIVTGNLLGSDLASITASGKMKDSATPDVTSFELTANAKINTDTFAVNMADLNANVLQGEQDIELVMASFDFTDSSEISISNLQAKVNGPMAVSAAIPALNASLDKQVATAQSINAEFENVKAQISNFKVTQFIDKPSASGALSVPSFDATKLIKTFEVDFEPADSDVLKAVAFTADFVGGLDGASLKNLVLDLDQTKLTGSASIANYEKPSVKFDLNMNEIDLDRYLPETDEAAEEEAVSGGEALAVPMAVFKDINANGSFKAQKLTSGGVSLTDIDVLVESTPGNVTITPKAKLYDGEIDGAIAYQEQGDTSRLKVKNEIGIVQLGELLDAADVTDQLKGLGSVLVDLVVTETNGVQSNEGTIKLLAKNGAVSGIDMKKILGQASSAFELYNKFSGDDKPKEVEVEGEKDDVTEFADLVGTFFVKDFLVTNDNFKMTAPGFGVTGKGQFDLAKETLDYAVNIAIAEGLGGALGEQLKSLSGKTIPVRCRGSFEAPVCLPDTKALYSLYLSSKLDSKKGALLSEKFGIEEGEKLSTKDALKQILINKATEKERSKERAVSERNELAEGERPVRERAEEDAEVEAEQNRPKTKKERREERKRKLLEGLFN